MAALTGAAAGYLILAVQAAAVIKVDLPVSKIYSTAKEVAAGTVSGVQASRKALEVTIGEVFKGEAGQPTIRFVVEGPADLVPRLVAGNPAVLFADDPGGQAVVHAADGWLLARKVPDASPPTWRIVGRHDIATSFPGSTAALIQVLQGLKKNGRTPLRDGVSHEAYLGVTKRLADLKVRPTFLVSADLNADGEPDLVLGTPDGVKLFLRTAQGYTDMTGPWGLAGTATHAAAADADGDGCPDLLLGRTLWLNEGARLRQVPGQLPFPPESEWLAVTLADATGDKRPDAIVLLKNGRLLTAADPAAPGKPGSLASRVLWQDGPPPVGAVFSTQWGDNGELHVLVIRPAGITCYAAGPTPGPPADFQRLTGVPFDIYKDFGGPPLRLLLAMADDYDGNGRDDLVVVTEGGGITLANRGFGAFLINGFAHKQFHSTLERPIKWTNPFPFRFTSATVAAPGPKANPKTNRRNLLVVTEDGKVYEVGNAPPWPPPATGP